MMGGVCLSVCRVTRPNWRTERPRKPKINRMEAHHKGNLRTYLEIKRPKVKVTGSQSVKVLLLAGATRYVQGKISEQPCSTTMLFQCGCSFRIPPIVAYGSAIEWPAWAMHHTHFLKLACFAIFASELLLLLLKMRRLKWYMQERCRGTLHSQQNVCWWSEKSARVKQVNDDVHSN